MFVASVPETPDDEDCRDGTRVLGAAARRENCYLLRLRDPDGSGGMPGNFFAPMMFTFR